MKRVRLLNTQFDPLTLAGTVDAVMAMISHGQRGWVSTVNVAILMLMRANPRLQRYVDRSAVVVADGQPLIWVAPWLDSPLPVRVTGVDLVEALCERASREGIGVYLLGATDGVVSDVSERLRARYPGLKLDFANGYFAAAEAAGRAAAVAASGARILIVGMGVPRQEYFLEEQWERLGVNIAIGVGGSFDVLSGLRRRAPAWIQAMGMEWLFRLMQEPRRLWHRYLVTNSKFLFLIGRALLGRWGKIA